MTDERGKDHIAHGSPEAYREFIGEMLAMASIQAQLGETYASIGDDAGLEYAIRRLVAYVRASRDTLLDLKEMKKNSAQRSERASWPASRPA